MHVHLLVIKNRFVPVCLCLGRSSVAVVCTGDYIIVLLAKFKLSTSAYLYKCVSLPVLQVRFLRFVLPIVETNDVFVELLFDWGKSDLDLIGLMYVAVTSDHGLDLGCCSAGYGLSCCSQHTRLLRSFW